MTHFVTHQVNFQPSHFLIDFLNSENFPSLFFSESSLVSPRLDQKPLLELVNHVKCFILSIFRRSRQDIIAFVFLSPCRTAGDHHNEIETNWYLGLIYLPRICRIVDTTSPKIFSLLLTSDVTWFMSRDTSPILTRNYDG